MVLLKRKKMTMVMGHMPHIDPRIDWVADLGATYFDVTLLGINLQGDPIPNNDFYTKRPFISRVLERGKSRNTPNKKGLVREVLKLYFKRTHLKHQLEFLALALLTLPLILFNMLVGLFLQLLQWISTRLEKLILRGLRKRGTKLAKKLKFNRLKQFWFGSFVQKIQEKQQKNSLTSQLNYQRKYYGTLNHFVWLLKHFKMVSYTLWRGLSEHSEPPTVLLCVDLDTLLSAVIFKQMHPECKLIYDAHEYWAFSYPGTRWYHHWFFVWLEKILIRHTDYATTVNPFLAKDMEKAFEYRPIHSLPNCEPLRSEYPVLHSLAGEKDIDELANGRLSFLFQGWASAERGLEELIIAWKEVDPVRAALFIRSPDCSLKDSLKRLAEDHRLLGKSVYFLKPVTEAELIPAAARADVGIIPYKPIIRSLKYCCPNKLSQYMQAGLMVLCNNLVFVRQVVENNQCGLSYDTAVECSIIEKVNWLLAHPDQVSAFKRNAYKLGQEQYNWQAQSRGLAEVMATFSDTDELEPSREYSLEKVKRLSYQEA